MPAILAFFGSLVAAIAGYLVKRFGERVALMAAFIAVWFVVVTTFTAGINTLINQIARSMPGGLVGAGLSMIPSNAVACATAIIAAHGAAYIYTVQYRTLVAKISA